VAIVDTRKNLVIGGAVSALALVLAACSGQEAGPTPQGGGEATGPDVLAIKLSALTTDECYLAPDQQVPQGCAKYITELGSTAGMVGQQPGLGTLAGQLSKGVEGYRSAHCDTVATPGNPCSQALSDIAGTLTSIKQKVDTQSTSG